MDAPSYGPNVAEGAICQDAPLVLLLILSGFGGPGTFPGSLQPGSQARIDTTRSAQAPAIAAGSAFGSISIVILMMIVSPWQGKPLLRATPLKLQHRLGRYGDNTARHECCGLGGSAGCRGPCTPKRPCGKCRDLRAVLVVLGIRPARGPARALTRSSCRSVMVRNIACGTSPATPRSRYPFSRVAIMLKG